MISVIMPIFNYTDLRDSGIVEKQSNLLLIILKLKI